MIQVKGLTKTYTTGDFVQKALDNVSLNFRDNEFVAILGPSGSGKTTFLNVVGGLDRYDSGDIIINGTSTKEFNDRQWDAYRNKSVGFVFQSYNLISHLSILDNVELSMTLAKVNSNERKQKALEGLDRVGLKQHAHKKPNQLSGGQMQRVAIARALVNDPDIILMDEPTGALDTKTSIAVLDLIKDISKDKLVVMVTHNQELATDYASRIVEFRDGQIINDTNPVEFEESTGKYQVIRTTMSFWTALRLSFKNILTKKWRTALTAFASSIGIIGVALILSLSNGFDKQIQEFETSALSNYPLTISRNHMMLQAGENPFESDLEDFSDENILNVFDPDSFDAFHTNQITQEYIEYLEALDEDLIDGYASNSSLQMNLLRKEEEDIINVSGLELASYPQKEPQDLSSYLQQYYDLLAGQFPTEINHIILVVDSNNYINLNTLNALGIDKDTNVSFEDVLNQPLRLISNDHYYVEAGPIFSINPDLALAYQSEDALDLELVGIIRIKEDQQIASLERGIYYAQGLGDQIIEKNQTSKIVLAQQESEVYVLSGQPFVEDQTNFTKEMALTRLGGQSMPSQISIYPKSFEAKQTILDYLDAYNEDKENEDKVLYLDLAQVITELTGNIMSGITLVLIAFAGISLIVSMIMIGIIIYISVLERTKEIGILRALGARKKDITRVFNAETFIIGLFSGLLGIGIAYLLTFPINNIIYDITDLENVAQLNPVHALLLIVLSLTLTIIGGFIPSKMAAKKDPVAALRAD